MNQKEKILIGIIPLLFLIPIIFLTWKDNQDPQENNFHLISNKKKNKNQQESSSFLFWIILIVTLALFTVIFWIIYQNQQKPEENQKPEETQNQEAQQPSNIIKSPIIKPKEEKQPNINKQLNKEELLKSLKFGICYDNNKIFIVFSQNPDETSAATIDAVLESDLNEQRQLLNNEFRSTFPKKELKQMLESMVKLLKTYLNYQFLYDVYQDKQKNNYAVLNKIAEKFVNSSTPMQIILPTEDFSSKNQIGEKADNDILEKINNNQHIDLLKTIFDREKATIIEDQKNKKEHYLFLRLFKFYKLIDAIYSDARTFLFQNKQNYPNQFDDLKSGKESIVDYGFFQNKINTDKLTENKK